jgi:hypothetical protein
LYKSASVKDYQRTLAQIRCGFARQGGIAQAVLDRFITNDKLNERHAREIAKLLTVNNLAPWLTREQALTEIIDIPPCPGRRKAG